MKCSVSSTHFPLRGSLKWAKYLLQVRLISISISITSLSRGVVYSKEKKKNLIPSMKFNSCHLVYVFCRHFPENHKNVGSSPSGAHRLTVRASYYNPYCCFLVRLQPPKAAVVKTTVKWDVTQSDIRRERGGHGRTDGWTDGWMDGWMEDFPSGGAVKPKLDGSFFLDAMYLQSCLSKTYVGKLIYKIKVVILSPWRSLL